jgi:tape measure domain-containing protein
LKIVSDGELEFAKNQKFLLTTAEDYGIEIKGLTKNFTEFWVASKGKLDAEEIKGIFASISKSAAVMGLSVEAQDSAFLALQQMMSKGTVQAEELKKQLGNSLPGAIKAATQAYQVLHPEMKVTEELFMSQMKAGKVVSSELLPELARQFEIIYGVESITRVDTMQAAQERMANSWTAWIKGLSSNSSTTKAIVAVMNGLAASLNEIVGVLLISVGSWAAYKLAIMLANVQNKLLMLTITGTTVATEAQVVVTGFQTTAQVANTVATSAATKAWKGLTLAMKANALGLIIVGLGLLVTAFQHFSKSAVEADDDIKELNSQFIVNREIMTESIIETNTMIKRYEELRDKAKDLGGATKLTKDEQKELNGLLAGLSKLVPNAVSDIDKYGKAVALNTGLLREWNKEQKEILRIKLANALRTEKENYADLVEEVADLEQTYKDLKTARLGSFEGAEQIVVDAELEYRTAKQRMILSKQRIKDLSGETQAEKNLKKAKDESQQALIKDVAYYEAKIAGMEERRPRLKTRQEGLDFQKEMDGYVKMRDFLQGEEEKINKKENKDQTDRLKRIEDANKSIFESELAVLEAKREIAKDDLELSTKSVGEKIVLARKLMEAELAIIERTFKEKQRLAKLEVKKNPLLNFDTVVTPDKEKSKTDSANATQARVATIGKVYSDFFKKANEDLGVSEELWNKYIKSLEMTDEDKERLKKWEEAMKLLKDGINDAFNMFAGDFADRIGFTDSFDLLMGKDGKDTTMFERLKDGEGAWKDYALAITTVMQDAFNFINQQDDMRHQAQLERLTEQKEVALTFAGESAAAKEKIESDYEKKRKQLDNRRAKDKKKQAMFNIALDTAQAVMTTLKEGGFFASPLAIAVAAMGAVQLAMVAAQKIPEYYVGTKNADEGWALTNERGAEIVTDKKGNIKDFGDKRGAKMQYLSKGDIVYTSEETKRLMFENEYNSLLDANGINQPKVVVSQGATASEIREVMIETLGGRPTLNMKFDKGGFVTYISKNGNITRSSEQRGSGIGIEL